MLQEHIKDSLAVIARMAPKDQMVNPAYHQLIKMTRVCCAMVGWDYEEELLMADPLAQAMTEGCPK